MPTDHLATEIAAVHRSTAIDDAVAFRIHRLNRLLRTHLQRVLAQRRPGLSPEQWFLLARVHQDGPVRPTDLSDPTLGDPPNVSRLVDALVRSGLLDRTPDPSDRRARIVSLTAAGTALVDGMMADAVQVRAEVFDGLDDADLAAFVAVLDTVEANVRARLDLRTAP